MPHVSICRRSFNAMKPHVVAVLSLLPFLPAFADVTLVRDGQPTAVIIVPEGLYKHIQKPADQLTGNGSVVPLAAVELADYLGKAGGVRPQIATETQGGLPEGPRVYVGNCKANADIAREPEEIVVLTRNGNLHLCGGDAGPGGMICKGTLFAVYDFIEGELGVRWLFPGEHGEVVPKRSTITIPELDRREQPRIAKRKLRNVAVSREETFAPVLEKWGVSPEAWKAAQGEAATGPWHRRMRLGQRIEINGGHAFAGWWERHGGEHPEWFALQPDGTRTQVPERERLCKSNDALWDEIARVKIAEFKADPSLLTASISPNDGGKNKFCMCEACRALDPADAPKILGDSQLMDPATKLPFAEYPSLSDRTFTFFNEIAARVGREMPDRDLVAYAYSVYRTVPTKVKQLEPNLIVGYVGMNLNEIEAWARIAPKLFIRPNDLGPAIDLGLPRNNAAWFAEAVKFGVEHKAIGFDFDNGHGNWSAHGLDYYVLCKALWHPDLDVAATIDDYCRAAYGPAADVMRQYHDALAKISDQVRADPDLGPRKPHAARLRRHYSGESLKNLESLIQRAEALQGDDPGVKARLQMAADSLTYAQLVTSLLEIAHEKKSPIYDERLTAVESLLKAKVLTPELAPLHSHRYLRMALAYAEREVE
ncbi:MAG: hypothetical protein B9S38_13695 [Verrucomicrobiia bacterium Tous-C4TDCM]|nr:MAG: hypothetical protein B9S38_13695 [Verrucomicrobiae bacterium Tous-C4TDCM]